MTCCSCFILGFHDFKMLSIYLVVQYSECKLKICKLSSRCRNFSERSLVERSSVFNFIRYQGKINFGIQKNFNANTTLVALFGTRFRSFFLASKKGNNTVKLEIAWDLSFTAFFFLGYSGNSISWWLTSNRIASRAIDLTRGN